MTVLGHSAVAMAGRLVRLLRSRRLLHDATKSLEAEVEHSWREHPLAAQHATLSAYIGFDPTSDSLHLGSLVQLVTMWRLRQAGLKPLALVSAELVPDARIHLLPRVADWHCDWHDRRPQR
jgi:hypothetical protein